MLHFAKWKVTLILAICLFGVTLAAPNLLDPKTAGSLPDWMPHKQISLGLDLQGGSHLLLEVEVDAVVKERLDSVVDSMRVALRKEKIGYRGLGIIGTSAKITIRDLTQLEKAHDLIYQLDPANMVLDDDGSGLIKLAFTEAATRDLILSAVQQSIEIVRRRIDETGVREPTIQRQGDDRILIQLPGVDDPERIKKLLGKTAKMSFHLLNERAAQPDNLNTKVPPGSMLLPGHDPQDQPFYLVKKRIVVSGESLVDSQPTVQEGRPVVSFRFDTIGAKKFGSATQKNVGKRLAIVLDGKVISAPRIQSAILGGSGIITGNFTVSTANDLALLLRAGALPAPLTILEERTVGPGLGADSIAAGKIASVIGLVAVVVFMVVIYGVFGFFADIALVANMILIAGALSALQASLTLPGIAGIVLTIGMAVDANVLIFERIREEVRAGRTPISAVDAGYKRAITTIVDANVTTLIAAILLFEFGSGPVRGFAITLAIGIVTSMFTATMLTRLVVATWLRRTRPTTLPI